MEFDEFIREVASLLGLQWRPFKRKGIKRKVERRMTEIGVLNFEEYLVRIRKDPGEQRNLSQILTVTISRFFRDKEVFQTIGQSILPALLQEKDSEEIRIWSIGCASGEEPYSLLLLWKEGFGGAWPRIRFSIVATDIDERMLARAKEGKFKKSSLKEAPEGIVRRFFNIENDSYLLDGSVREGIEFKKHDLLREEPFLGTDMVFCRNLAFTYFSKESQIDVLRKIATSLRGRGYLVIGKDESLPLTYPTLFTPVFPAEKIYRKFTK
jgi:chemotaxis methyl-accepting protein methylase